MSEAIDTRVRTRVAIVGGGLAGLCAARSLRAAGIDFVVLEARDRPGGRILTVDAAGRPAERGFDLGPSWFWPEMHPDLAALIAELDLEHHEQHGEGDMLFERPGQGRPQRFPGMRQEPRSMRLSGGTGALVRVLMRDLPAGALRLGARVTGVTLSGDGAVLQFGGEGHPARMAADQVILALPPRLLQATVRFQPPLPAAVERRWRDAATWMAPHAKFVALFDRAFWRDAGLSGGAQSGVGPMAEIHDATTDTGEPALFGFVGVGAAQRAAIGGDALRRACVQQLVRLFGPAAASPSATLLKDWADDDLTATPDDRYAAGHPVPTAQPWVTGPWDRRLLLAGSETSGVAPGYLAGAVDAGLRAAAEAVARLAAPAGSRAEPVATVAPG